MARSGKLFLKFDGERPLADHLPNVYLQGNKTKKTPKQQQRNNQTKKPSMEYGLRA